MNKSYRLLAAFFALLLASCGQGGNDLFPVQQGRLYGYINRTGKYVIDTQFIDACCFVDGVALVTKGGDKPGFGFIDRSGKYIVPPAYALATSFSEGIAFVITDTSCPIAIDPTGAVLFKLDSAEKVENYHQGLAAYSILSPGGEQWGFIDKQGHVKIPPRFAEARFFSGDLCGVMNEDRKWGFVDKEGKMIIDFRFDNIAPFNAGVAEVVEAGKWGIIDKSGKYIIEPQYANIDVDGDRFLVNINHKWGWINSSNRAIIDPQFADAFPYHAGKYAPIMAGKKWGYINREGKIAISPRYDFAFAFDGDLAVVRLNDKYGFINSQGQYIIESRYNEVAIDYFITRMTGNSAHFGLSTEKNTPQHVAFKWLTSFYHFRFDDAKKISTEETITLLNQFSNLTGLMQDSSKQQMLQIRVGIKGYNEDGGRPQVVYTTSDNPGKDEKLYLLRKDGKWLVQFSKNDSAADSEPPLTEQ